MRCVLRWVIATWTLLLKLADLIFQFGHLAAFALALVLFVQIQANILTMEKVVDDALNQVTCTARRLNAVDQAQSYAADCAELMRIEANRVETLEIELDAWATDYDQVFAQLHDQQTVNRSMNAYIHRLHKTLRDNGLPLPPKQNKPLQ